VVPPRLCSLLCALVAMLTWWGTLAFAPCGRGARAPGVHAREVHAASGAHCRSACLLFVGVNRMSIPAPLAAALCCEHPGAARHNLIGSALHGCLLAGRKRSTRHCCTGCFTVLTLDNMLLHGFASCGAWHLNMN
jgi:hypothetical protein